MFIIPDWDEFQAYRDRRPPWIKLHRTLLDNQAFQSLPLSARAMLPMLWLLAPETEDYMSGRIELSANGIAYRLRISEAEVEKNLQILITAGFIKDVRDCTELYESVPRDRDITETKTETDPRKAGYILPGFLPKEAWMDFVKYRKQSKSVFTERSAQLALAKLEKLHDAGQDVVAVINQTIERGYTGLFPVGEIKSAKTKDPVYDGVLV